MKFFFADNLDLIDPGFDFEHDEHSANRRVQRDDVYPHEYFDTPPYDGILVSRAIVGDEQWHGKYTTAQSLRFKREGARAFLRYFPPGSGGAMMGDCGAFSYAKREAPPYSIPETVNYYTECGFTHGVSIDHVILGYNEKVDFENNVPEDWQRRYDLTLQLAEVFWEYCQKHHVPFQPIGVAQGWSPGSYQKAVRQLMSIGYDYIAIGGMVPLGVSQIHHILEKVREVAPPQIRLHLFGFTKADNIGEFVKYNIESFDSTSPMLRAFKDGRRNYMSQGRWYTAIRVPSADENRKFKELILAGIKEQRYLRELESASLRALRAYDTGTVAIEQALEAVVRYGSEFSPLVRKEEYRRTLTDRPWAKCPCRACRESGIEVIIFRGSNRNRRRGFHNLYEFHRQFKNLPV